MPQEMQQNSLDSFKVGVDALLERREYFIRKIFPRLEKDRDYYEIKGRRSLGKAGAEKIGASYSFVATFRRDSETLLSFKNTEGLIALVCDLTRNNVLVGQGRGAAELKNNNGDVNKTIKMCQKSAFIDAVIRASGLSDIFTQDLEALPENKVVELPPASKNYFPKNQVAAEDDVATDKQKDLLRSLIAQRIPYGEERERWFTEMETASKFDASEMISSFLVSSYK